MKKFSDVLVIGAGASGLMFSWLLARGLHRQQGAGKTITILEKNSRIGKKLSATGNGRCNFTNLHMTESCYYGDLDWISEVIKKVSPERVMEQFAQMGVLHRERDGYVYPHTNQAGTVVSALERECKKERVDIILDCPVKNIYKKTGENGFGIVTDAGTISCDFLVMATGSAANRETGGDTSGYDLVRKLGLEVSPVYPALTGFCCSGKIWKSVAGTRIQGTFSLGVEEEWLEGETGEIQMVKDGVSGIPVFQLCRVGAEALKQGKSVRGRIDFVPSLSLEQLREWIGKFGIEGIVPSKWVPVLEGKKAEEIKQYTFPIRETFGLERAQVAAGGCLSVPDRCGNDGGKENP